MIFEYGEGTYAHAGCGATLMGEMWYFGGFNSDRRQVWIVYIYKILIILFRWVKSKVANWSDKKIYLLILNMVHATLFLNQLQEFFFASAIMGLKHATRKLIILRVR